MARPARWGLDLMQARSFSRLRAQLATSLRAIERGSRPVSLKRFEICFSTGTAAHATAVTMSKPKTMDHSTFSNFQDISVTHSSYGVPVFALTLTLQLPWCHVSCERPSLTRKQHCMPAAKCCAWTLRSAALFNVFMGTARSWHGTDCCSICVQMGVAVCSCWSP